jgi:hypothetical protein
MIAATTDDGVVRARRRRRRRRRRNDANVSIDTSSRTRTRPSYPASHSFERISKPHTPPRKAQRRGFGFGNSCAHLFPDKVFLLRQPHPELGLEFLLQRLDGGFLQVRPAKDGWQVRHDVALESIHPRRRFVRSFGRRGVGTRKARGVGTRGRFGLQVRHRF